jgi:hypothetical protein
LGPLVRPCGTASHWEPMGCATLPRPKSSGHRWSIRLNTQVMRGHVGIWCLNFLKWDTCWLRVGKVHHSWSMLIQFSDFFGYVKTCQNMSCDANLRVLGTELRLRDLFATVAPKDDHHGCHCGFTMHFIFFHMAMVWGLKKCFKHGLKSGPVCKFSGFPMRHNETTSCRDGIWIEPANFIAIFRVEPHFDRLTLFGGSNPILLYPIRITQWFFRMWV